MNTEIIVSIIGVFGAFLGAILGSQKQTAVMEEKIVDIKEDIEKLSTRVDKHNNLIERMVIVEQSTKSAHKRLDEINK